MASAARGRPGGDRRLGVEPAHCRICVRALGSSQGREARGGAERSIVPSVAADVGHGFGGLVEAGVGDARDHAHDGRYGDSNPGLMAENKDTA